MELTNDWIAGFVDGDGCFKIVQTSSKKGVPYTRYCFVVSQNKRSVNILYALKHKFGCGSVNKAGGDMYEYRVTNKEHLKNLILPFFLANSLKTEKQKDFKLFYEQLTGQIYKWIDPGITRDWLVGFSDAEGCFYVSMVKDYPRPQFVLGFHLRDQPILEAIHTFLNCGTVYRKRPTSGANYAVYQISDRQGFQILIDTFTTGTNRVLLKTSKRISFLKWKQIVRLIKQKQHLTQQGKDKIRKLIV